MNFKTFEGLIANKVLAICKMFIICSKLFKFILFNIRSKEKFDVTDVTNFVTDVTLYEI